MATDTGTGTTITFGTSGWTGQITNVDWDQLTRAVIETSHLGTADANTYMPSDRYDPGEITIEGNFDGDDETPIAEDPETITVTFPLKSGDSTPGNWAATGFATSFRFGLPDEEKQTFTMTIKLSGAITYTAAS